MPRVGAVHLLRLGHPGDVRCTTALPPKADVHLRSRYVAFGRVEDGRGSLGHAATLRFPSPLIEPDVPISGIRLVWGFLCQGCITPFLSRVVTPFFCSTRAASILPSRPHIPVAVARSGGQGRRFFGAAEGLSLTDASTAAGCPGSGGR